MTGEPRGFDLEMLIARAEGQMSGKQIHRLALGGINIGPGRRVHQCDPQLAQGWMIRAIPGPYGPPDIDLGALEQLPPASLLFARLVQRGGFATGIDSMNYEPMQAGDLPDLVHVLGVFVKEGDDLVPPGRHLRSLHENLALCLSTHGQMKILEAARDPSAWTPLDPATLPRQG